MHVFFSVASAINNKKQEVLESYIRTKMQTLYIHISQPPIAHLTFLLISSVAQLQ